jgi:hypothetical protein
LKARIARQSRRLAALLLLYLLLYCCCTARISPEYREIEDAHSAADAPRVSRAPVPLPRLSDFFPHFFFNSTADAPRVSLAPGKHKIVPIKKILFLFCFS